MATTYVTAAGDQMDLICTRHYGRAAGAVEQVLAANPQVAAQAHRLPAGLTLVLPDLDAADTAAMARLWD